MIEHPAYMTVRDAIDAIVTFPPSWIVFVLVHGAALYWLRQRNDIRPVLLVNIALGLMLFTYNASILTRTYGYDDLQMLPVVIGAINFIAAAAAFAGIRVPRPIILVGFGFVFIACLAMAALTYSLRFDRLI